MHKTRSSDQAIPRGEILQPGARAGFSCHHGMNKAIDGKVAPEEETCEVSQVG